MITLLVDWFYLSRESIEHALSEFVGVHFQVSPCSRCFESEMILNQISPNGNSIQYQCTNCNKKSHAAALSAEARERAAEYHESWSGQKVVFTTTEATLPYEQTTRVSLPESTRSEVWRRDMGMCSKCGAKENLQFDHIIPVSKGGSNGVSNLQLLCQGCNASKSNKI